ncbi:MAG: HlyD family efflux transporter periplasmic adaptor subunit, partial [Azovibrio sp.]|nr:HlyD family efflux transporter periplasmic adaptor subunit [Azovibrio sp.]
EVKLRKLQRAQDFRKEVETQLSDVQREVNSLADKLTALKEEFERTEIKAPIAGFVVGMDVTTIGGVIRAGDRIMDIVPEGDVLVVEAQLPVNLINNIQVGQLATMHFQIVTSGGAMPAIEGKLVRVSADRLTDPKTGAPYYSARLEITKNGEAELRKFKIIPQPGMQADVVVLTGERTVLKYLLQPLLSRLAFGMKEH